MRACVCVCLCECVFLIHKNLLAGADRFSFFIIKENTPNQAVSQH